MDPEYGLEDIENVENDSSFSLRFARTPLRHEHTVTPAQSSNTLGDPQPTSLESLESQYKPSTAHLKRLHSTRGHATVNDGNRSCHPLSDSVKGYPMLAAHIEMRPYSGIYRRFTALNAQNVLYLQAELTDLERRLREQQTADSNDTRGSKSKYATSWYCLEFSREEGDTKQLDLVIKIREVLKEYNQALIQQSTILNYPDPEIEDIHYLQNIIQARDMGPLAMHGMDAVTWGSVANRKSALPDLVTSRFRPPKDRFTIWATKQATYLILRIHRNVFGSFSRLPWNEPLEEGAVYRAVYRLTVIVASLIPISSIAVLYYVRSMPARLAIIAAFNVLVSICLMGLADAKWVEVFAITAAFAAVQVVFVATDKN